MKTWNTVDGPVTEADLNGVEHAIKSGKGSSALILQASPWPSRPRGGDRRVDRALQLLKAAGRIKYDHHGRRWTVVDGGGK